MVIFRLIALILVVVALLLLGYDALRWLQNGETFALTSLSNFIDIVAHTDWAKNPPANWPGFVKTVMAWPSWAVIGVVGLVLALLFRRRD
jgi:hypothetical protein